jgi:hypothetical protein
MSLSCECCVLSCRGLCDKPIARAEESYRLWSVIVCDLEKLMNEEALIPWSGPEGSRRFSLPDFHDIRHLTVVRSSPSRTGRLYPQDYLISTPVHFAFSHPSPCVSLYYHYSISTYFSQLVSSLSYSDWNSDVTCVSCTQIPLLTHNVLLTLNHRTVYSDCLKIPDFLYCQIFRLYFWHNCQYKQRVFP